MYDIYTFDENLVREIVQRTGLNYEKREFLFELSEQFVFFDVSKKKLKKISHVLDKFNGHYELWNSESGKCVYPSQSAIGIEQILDSNAY